ncbi:GNAT family N-acetyltransferase [Methylobacterium frigidaeris]|uniref:Acetyltransferase Pat n=1 Tax=Methylobacterium frigidaeris TaxID=2038277 RepID=A0AA37M4M7_9HYPH|nr:GNAT family N-acetyltransferase [Methylobacterium frigidaeris]PIK74546.1 GNAT family N-acetyltransferase [Methylobacterium frigidaeris]GJD62662.1 Acetyltransferase Pat [Methylobacterium frigidaeris]
MQDHPLRTQLPAGTLVRRLWSTDRDAVVTLFRGLDPDSRFDRFMGAVSEARAAAYASHAVAAKGLIFGAFTDGILRGVGELRPAGATAEAEIAFAVAPGHRGRGLGAALGARLAQAARNGGTRRLHLRCLPGNRGMRALAQRLGAELRSGGREVHAVLALSPPTLFSLWREGVEGLFDVAAAASAACSATWPIVPVV